MTFERDGAIGVITLNRPGARNAINAEVARDMEAALDQLEQDDALRVGILAANTEGQSSPVFCAGADLKALGSGERNTGTRGGFGGFVYRERSKPIIAAVDGLATAGGCEIVLECDLVVASDRSSFGLAEVKRNLIAAAGGLFRLPRAIGRAAAMEAILTGEPFPVSRAYELGMVNRVVPPHMVYAEARALALQIAAAAPLAVAASRRVVLASAYESDQTLRDMSNREIGAILRSDDTKEGLAAFVEKRPPRWSGR